MYLGWQPFRPITLLQRLLRAVREFQPDILHVFKPIGYSGLVGWWGATGRLGKLTAVLDSDDYEGPAGWSGRKPLGVAGRVRGWQEVGSIRAFRQATVASEWLRGFVCDKGIDPSRVLLLPQGHSYSNGGETKPANQAVASQATLLWYTRFTEASPDRVAGLVAPLLQADSSLRLIVFGDEVESGDKDRAQAAFRALGVSGRVQWVAYGPGGLGALLTQHSDPVGIYPLDDDLTDRARSPTKLVELMAHGVPVVAEAVGEARRYLGTFENECLAPVANPELFQARVSRLLAKRSTRIELGERLGFAASAWHWDRLARGLLDWYDELAAGRL